MSPAATATHTRRSRSVVFMAGIDMRTCEYCGAPLVRNPKHSNKQWAAKRFCERACAGAAVRKKRQCACGCDEEPLPGRKYVRGHRPLKLTKNGYRRVWVGRSHPCADPTGMVLHHRLVLFEAGIDVPSGFQVHHRNGDKTDNRLENLELISASEHTRLHWLERRTNRCPQGHLFDEENTAFNPSGWRYCKQCNRDRVRRYRTLAGVSDGDWLTFAGLPMVVIGAIGWSVGIWELAYLAIVPAVFWVPIANWWYRR